MKLVRWAGKSLRRLHHEEEGLEALQVVMIVAVAAICLLLIKLYWPSIANWFGQMVNSVTGWKEPSGDNITQPSK